MARIKFSARSSIFNNLSRQSDARGETNDCTVKAIATVCNVSYDVAHAALKKQGRVDRKGCYVWEQKAAVEDLGFTAENIQPSDFIRKYPGVHKKLQNVTTHHMERFWKVWTDGNTYLIYTGQHVGAVINGVNHDWTKGKAKRVVKIYKITKV